MTTVMNSDGCHSASDPSFHCSAKDSSSSQQQFKRRMAASIYAFSDDVASESSPVSKRRCNWETTEMVDAGDTAEILDLTVPSNNNKGSRSHDRAYQSADQQCWPTSSHVKVDPNNHPINDQPLRIDTRSVNDNPSSMAPTTNRILPLAHQFPTVSNGDDQPLALIGPDRSSWIENDASKTTSPHLPSDGAVSSSSNLPQPSINYMASWLASFDQMMRSSIIQPLLGLPMESIPTANMNNCTQPSGSMDQLDVPDPNQSSRPGSSPDHRQVASPSSPSINNHPAKANEADSIFKLTDESLAGSSSSTANINLANYCINPIKKYNSFDECGHYECRYAQQRDHFHCNECRKIIVRREEVIRHAKWHRKREESLQYGFARFSPCDDCSNPDCPHNRRQTHYHCVHTNCNKVYISTSDVQMHANFHRKDAVIMQEGFQRFRASESCGVDTCPFAYERTTHFHCRRPKCRFTFKHKADMEKHKLHHQKNDNFAKEGFRKYIKCESCDFAGCKYSGVVNHIHCIRPGCDYVIHSSSQILSHKRKHDRRFLSTTPEPPPPPQPLTVPLPGSQQQPGYFNSPVSLLARSSTSTPTDVPVTTTADDSGQGLQTSNPGRSKDLISELRAKSTFVLDACIKASRYPGELRLCDTEQLTSDSLFTLSANDNEGDCRKQLDPAMIGKLISLVQLQVKFHSPSSDSCTRQQCSANDRGHYHCHWPNCFKLVASGTSQLRCSDWLSHLWQLAMLQSAFMACSKPECDSRGGNHWHCCFWPACAYKTEQIGSRLDASIAHLASHDKRLLDCYWLFDVTSHSLGLTRACKLEQNNNSPISPFNGEDDESINAGQQSSLTAFTYSSLPRRRGRPPKYAKYIHVPHLVVPNELRNDQPELAELIRSMFDEVNKDEADSSNPFNRIIGGVKLYLGHEHCPDPRCQFNQSPSEHYHCIQPRCYMASSSLRAINAHRNELHKHLTILNGFEYFDYSVDCRRPACQSNKRPGHHFHCIRPNCDYAFVRASTMQQHSRKHNEASRYMTPSGRISRLGKLPSSKTPSSPSAATRSSPTPPPMLPLGVYNDAPPVADLSSTSTLSVDKLTPPTPPPPPPMTLTSQPPGLDSMPNLFHLYSALLSLNLPPQLMSAPPLTDNGSSINELNWSSTPSPPPIKSDPTPNDTSFQLMANPSDFVGNGSGGIES